MMQLFRLPSPRLLATICSFAVIVSNLVQSSRCGVLDDVVEVFQIKTKELKAAYHHLDTYLSKRALTDLARNNGLEVNKLVKTLNDGKDVDIERIKKELPGVNIGRLSEVAHQFQRLFDREGILNPCSPYAKAVLRDNDALTGHWLSTAREDDTQPNRVRKIIFFYAKKQAKICLKHYHYQYNQLVKEKWNYKLKQARGFSRLVVRKYLEMRPKLAEFYNIKNLSSFIDDDPASASQIAVSVKFFKAPTKLIELFDASVEKFAIILKNPNAASLYLNSEGRLDKLKYRQLVITYLVEPCKNWVEIFKDVFEMKNFPKVHYSLRVNLPDKVRRHDPENNFYKDSVVYQLCKNFVRDSDSVIGAMVKLRKKKLMNKWR